MALKSILCTCVLLVAFSPPSQGFGQFLQPFAVERERVDFYPRKIKQVDYFAEMCSLQNKEKSLECSQCKVGVDKCHLPMVGFENYGYVDDRKVVTSLDQKKIAKNDVVSLTVSSIGALTISAGRCCYDEYKNLKNGTVEWSPSFDARSLGQSFWATVLDNSKARGAKVCTEYVCPPPRFAFSQKDSKIYKSKNPLVAMLINYVGEFNDVNNDGKYSKSVDGEIVNKIEMKCLEWKTPSSQFDSNKTSAFVGERSSWTFANQEFETKSSPYEACRGVEPARIPAGTITIVVTSTDFPTKVSDEGTIEQLILTQKNVNVKVVVKNFPFKAKFNPQSSIRPRLVFRTMLSSNDNKDAFFVVNDHTIQVKTFPTNRKKGYFKWEPTAEVEFPGSNHMVGSNNKLRAPLTLSIERHNQDAIVLPRVASRSEVPYSALYGLFLDAVLYRHTYKADIGVGGMAYNPSYVELNLIVSYGSIPKQKEYFHPGAMLGILFSVCFVFLYSGYKGWLVEYDWRTGLEYEKEDIAALIGGDKRKILSPYICRRFCKWPTYHIEEYPQAGFKYIAPDFLRCCLGINDVD